MEKEKFKKVAILGLCLSFMIGTSACLSQQEFNGLLAFIFWGIVFFISIIYALSIGFTRYPAITTIIVALCIIIPVLFSSYKTMKHKKLQENLLKEKAEKELQENIIIQNDSLKAKTSLLQLCKTEQKLTIHDKIPLNSGVVLINNELLDDNFFNKEKFLIDSNKLGFMEFFVDGSYKKIIKIPSLSNSQKIPTITTTSIQKFSALYEFIVNNISTGDDIHKNIDRQSIQIRKRLSTQVLSEYITFSRKPFKNMPIIDCYNVENDSMYDPNVKYRYFFEHAVE